MASQDPNDYSAVLFVPGFIPLKRIVMDLTRKWTADGRHGQVAFLNTAFARFESDLRRIAVRTAEKAQHAIVKEEEGSRVRPDTGGGGGPRLEDFLGRSEPVDLVPGSVLVNNERELELGGVDWWWTNEEGYSGHIGREIRGVFMPGGTPPIADLPRLLHQPIFRPLGGDRAPKGTIKEPIPERRFVQKGFDSLRAPWHAEVRAAEGRFVDALRRAQLSIAQQSLPGGPGGRRRP